MVVEQEISGGSNESVDTSQETSEASTQNTESQESGSSEGSAPEKEAAALLEQENQETAVGDKEVAAFAPNFKFKVLDKEMEIPEKFRALMTDADSEKTVKELFEKAEGLPSVKQKLENVRTENESNKKEVAYHKNFVGRLNRIYEDFAKTGDYHKLDAWFESFKIPENIILNYAIEKAKLAEMTPDQQQIVRSRLASDRSAETLRQQNEGFQSEIQRMSVESKTSQLDAQMINPEYKAMADSFDTQVGRSGAFREEVRKAGVLAFHMEKLDLSPEEAIKRVITNYGLKARAAAATSAAQDSGSSGQQATVIPKKPASTIPNLGAGSKSPVTTSKVKNMDELKKLRDVAWGKSS